MSQTLAALTSRERRLLRFASALVPPAQRRDWLRTWHAELWDLHHRRRRRARAHSASAGLSVGMVRDALWLRTHSWRVRFDGTAGLCLASLTALCAIAATLCLALHGDWLLFLHSLHAELVHSLVAAPLVLFVTFATGHLKPSCARRGMLWVRRQLFLAAKIGLVLLLALFLSADAAQPVHSHLPATADLLQVFFFVLCALLGLRWVFSDQEGRCKYCLHALSSPARVGRPSHNLLEWSGTELACKHGHGRLNVPEMQTSWCEYNQWVDRTQSLDRRASVL